MAEPNSTLPNFSQQDKARFYSFLTKQDAASKCQLWTGSLDKDGYGWFTAQGRLLRAHRVAYCLSSGTNPGYLHVCHTCDNPQCCNPEHLFLGTNQENTADRVRKNRSAKGPRPDKSGSARGERQHLAKLTADNVKTIRKMRCSGLTQQQIADQFPFITRRAIAHVLNGKTWTHVK